MTEDEVISAVVRFVARVSGIVAIRANEGGNAPALPYAMVNFTGLAEVREHAATIEFTDTGLPNSEGEHIISAAPVMEIEWRFSVHAYGADPASKLRPIKSALKISQVLEPALPLLVIFDSSQIRSVPDWIDNRWEPRAQMDLFVRGIIRDDFDVDVIDHAAFDIVKLG